MLPIDPAGMYLTQLAKPVKIGRYWYYPGQRLILRGDILQGVIDNDPSAVAFYQQVPWPTVVAEA